MENDNAQDIDIDRNRDKQDKTNLRNKAFHERMKQSDRAVDYLKNKNRASKHSTARSFIKKLASLHELDELEVLIIKRRNELGELIDRSRE